MIVGHSMPKQYMPHIDLIKSHMYALSGTFIVDYACISSYDDFDIYDSILSFKYKVTNNKKQLEKVCDFLSSCPEKYDWYIKTRPEVLLLEVPDILSLSTDSIHARVRGYIGTKKILFGCSVGGTGGWSSFNINTIYSDNKKYEWLDDVWLDDHIYIFNKYVVDNGAFAILTPEINKFLPWNYDDKQDESIHNSVWNHRNIKKNPIGIHLIFKKINSNGDTTFSGESGHVNIQP
jgi:hypothetical protein